MQIGRVYQTAISDFGFFENIKIRNNSFPIFSKEIFEFSEAGIYVKALVDVYVYNISSRYLEKKQLSFAILNAQ